MSSHPRQNESKGVSRRTFALLAGSAVTAGLAGCTDDPMENGDAPATNGGDDPSDLDVDDRTVVASMPALWDFTRQVAGDGDDTVQPIDIVPVGEHGHDWNPEPATVEDVDHAGAFVYMRDFAAWQDDAAAALEDDGGTVVIDASAGIDFFDSPAEDNDEHWWMDPVYAQEGVSNIADGLAEMDPDNADYYRDNAAAFTDELQALHEDFQDIVDRAELTSIVVATHDSFQWWNRQYGIDVHSPVGTSPDDAATPQDVQEIEELMEDEGIEHVLYDVGEPAQLAESLAAETDADILPLTPVETQIDGAPELDTGIEMEPDWGYLEHFYEINLPSLETALHAE
ncbi:ABC-type transport system periplasmic substrate-binding protein (probable substrate zinc/manganese/metal ions) [Natronomonas pharaonis DSM 2160]|uniref:ABC-type transport system periplasmic substrate-binding protein (Probable substrate zinc/manganese/metal ions) n=1 Tax=Natronomonas pharaonis (strain ATCC 35678 / DSM 2160 / CIP 103997 / JCM 8858 / NBRC 14720 / NCIMB 2260 / Gabara) TaxID=348780 RepID=A0A1U7EYZ0_NATPD|nr:metal ABC transporter substrate-binding protein [Natronomonas pharaonis]CAI50455.1 ABC-type transport system periplasmic substrate-binding protein (probable substrate zinc/manganese/metal ions) [Natronomonas pharaonis DSM 2160]